MSLGLNNVYLFARKTDKSIYLKSWMTMFNADIILLNIFTYLCCLDDVMLPIESSLHCTTTKQVCKYDVLDNIKNFYGSISEH